MIHRDSDNRRTVLTIVNYRVFQDVCDTDKDTNKDADKSQYNNDNNDNNNYYRRTSKPYLKMMSNNVRYSDIEEDLLRSN